MIAIAVDDELPMLYELAKAVKASPDIEAVSEFQSCSAALEWLESHVVDVAFLDIHMRGIGGLALAERIQSRQPDSKIVFCTGYSEYAVEAFRIHVSGYLMNPITAEAVQKEIDHIKGGDVKKKLLRVRCFGNFEVFAGEEPLAFRRSRTKEVFAYLVDRNGAAVTAREICAVLWENTDDDKNMNYLRQLFSDLRSSLRSAGADAVLQSSGNRYFLDMDQLDCDYARYLQFGTPKFYGEYMSQYSWAEETCALLLR